MAVNNLRIDGETSIIAPPDATCVLTWTPERYSEQDVCRDDSADMFYPTRVYEDLPANTNTVTVQAPPTIGQIWYFCIQAKNSESWYEYGNRVNVRAAQFTPATTPENVALSSGIALPGESVTLSWSASEPGINGEIKGYEVARFDAQGGYIATLATVDANTLQCTVQASATGGEIYYIRVRALEQYAQGNSAYSSAVELLSVYDPDPATILSGGTTFNPRPRLLIRTGDGLDPFTVDTNWHNWTPSRAAVNKNENVVMKINNNVPEGYMNCWLYINGRFNTHSQILFDFTYAVPTWTDTPIVAGETVIKAAHINELRAALNTICDYYGISRTAWAETVEAGTTPSYNWPAHMLEIQQTITRIAGYVNTWDTQSSALHIVLPEFLPIDKANAAALNQIREIITML